jgi:hypothetical protein
VTVKSHAPPREWLRFECIKNILLLLLACRAPRSSAVSLCSQRYLVCFIQHPSQIQILKPAFGSPKRTQNLNTHVGTHCKCRSAAPFLSIVLDPSGVLKFRSPNHVAAVNVSIHYKIEIMYLRARLNCWRFNHSRTVRHSDTQTFRNEGGHTTDPWHAQAFRQSDIQTIRHSDIQILK